MAFGKSLAGRIRDALARKRGIEEKKMFGCICFILNGNALAGVWKSALNGSDKPTGQVHKSLICKTYDLFVGGPPPRLKSRNS